MATTKIWSVKNRLDHVLEYVSNEDKTIDKLGSYVSRNEATENQKYMTCVNCSGNDPFTSMMNLKEAFHDTSNIIAYHAIQSFKRRKQMQIQFMKLVLKPQQDYMEIDISLSYAHIWIRIICIIILY